MTGTSRTRELPGSEFPKISQAGDFGKVAVLYGGDSAEREISLMTGKAVHAALIERGVDAHLLDAAGDYLPQLTDAGFNRVWIALHGRGGEDGTLQRRLDEMHLPYTGSGPDSAALAMDKLASKQALLDAGLPTAPWQEVRSAEELAAAADTLGLPLIVKPALEGSSIGMSKVNTISDIASAWQNAAAADSPVMAEAWISGGEYTAAILQGEVLPLIRIEVQGGFYDYEAKYFSDETGYHCPAGLSAEAEAQFAALAMQAFMAVGCDGWGRVDFMLNEAGEPLILEVNTVPGMTSHSLVPMAAAQAGIDFGGLVWRILETSFDRLSAEEVAHGT
ncbi:MAG: D-alanine--D-alanine ligase [Gammaproteobacteria bacterium]|nr:D-alanine--D-alanine ligase [Gammaproteobacteria bacterium]NND54883.1 D-alanine--D-alanine ligase [Gammaproteobacteria bacterium]